MVLNGSPLSMLNSDPHQLHRTDVLRRGGVNILVGSTMLHFAQGKQEAPVVPHVP